MNKETEEEMVGVPGEMVSLGSFVSAFDSERKLAEEVVIDDAKNQALKKQPLYVTDAERVIIASVLIDAEQAMNTLEDIGVRPSDFYVKKHETIFRAMMKLREEKSHIDAITIADALNRMAKLEEIGGAVTLSRIEATIPTAAAVASNARMVIDKARLRTVTRLSTEAIERAQLGYNPVDVMDKMQEDLEEAVRHRGGNDFVDLSSATSSALSKLPSMGGKVQGISTGFPDVDHMFRMCPGDLIIVAGRPSMGKTQFVLDMLRETTVIKGEAAALFSLEMTDEQILTRLIGSKSGINLKQQNMPAHEMSEVTGAAAQISDAPIYIDDSPTVSIGDIRSRARHAHRRQPLSLVVVDYLQLIDIPEPTGNSSQDIGRISKGLKQLARELRCAVVALSQLNRGVESRSDRRPVMSDLRESGNLEQDADVVAFLYREEYYAKDRTPDDMRGVAEVIVSKNRAGPTGSAKMRFDTNIPRFTSLATDEW